MQLLPFDFQSDEHLAGAADAWSDACGRDLSISSRFMAYNTRPPDGVELAGRVAVEGSRVLGFVLASRLLSHPDISAEDQGWVNAIAMRPSAQRRGGGSDLMHWAENWLRRRGVKRVALGDGLRPFLPALPEELCSQGFFTARGYQPHGETWDVARDLGDGQPIARRSEPPYAQIGTAALSDAAALLDFLAREFPGGWHYEAHEFLRLGGDISDFVLLRQVDRVAGFAWITSASSARPLDRYYPQRLPKPWGQLGPIGVAKAARGAGWGGLLLQAGLMTLRDRGVRGCVIDWTGLLDFYGKYGFKPYRRYRFYSKTISSQ